MNVLLDAVAGLLIFAAMCALSLGVVALIIRLHPRILGPIDAEVKLAQVRYLCEHRPMDPELRAELLDILK